MRRVETMFERYGAWAIIMAAITPLPYKVFAIAAGVFDMDLRRFILASLIGRGLRFLTIGVLITAFGESVSTFLDSNFEEVTIAAGVGTVVVVAIAVVFKSLRGKNTPGADSREVDGDAGRDPDKR